MRTISNWDLKLSKLISFGKVSSQIGTHYVCLFNIFSVLKSNFIKFKEENSITKVQSWLMLSIKSESERFLLIVTKYDLAQIAHMA